MALWPLFLFFLPEPSFANTQRAVAQFFEQPDFFLEA